VLDCDPGIVGRHLLRGWRPNRLWGGAEEAACRGLPWRRGSWLWEAGTVAHRRHDRGLFIGEVWGGR
jgi:hypothetical protein